LNLKKRKKSPMNPMKKKNYNGVIEGDSISVIILHSLLRKKQAVQLNVLLFIEFFLVVVLCNTESGFSMIR